MILSRIECKEKKGEELMYYAITDRNDKDRENPVVDVFSSPEKAAAYAEELCGPRDPEEGIHPFDGVRGDWIGPLRSVEIEEWDNLENNLGERGSEEWDWWPEAGGKWNFEESD
jgi:hypothetical protein